LRVNRVNLFLKELNRRQRVRQNNLSAAKQLKRCFVYNEMRLLYGNDDAVTALDANYIGATSFNQRCLSEKFCRFLSAIN
jgi:hypothetical protein